MINKKILLIAIPAHGWTSSLEETIISIRNNLSEYNIDADILITNSGIKFSKSVFDNISEVLISSELYWSGAVSVIYQRFIEQDYNYLLLMNHDCSLSNGCINELLNFAKYNKKTVSHALTLYKDTNVVWWAGTIHKCLRRLSFPGQNIEINVNLMDPIPTDSMMGQCILLPRDAVKLQYLHINELPHYFADSVQTCEMRRNGFQLFVIPTAIAFTDQSDSTEKNRKITPFTFEDLIKSWSHPSSSRNLKSVLYSSYYHQDCIAGKLIMPIYEVLGKVVLSFYQYLKIQANKIL
jgi:GT2 family glycosyltransferase